MNKINTKTFNKYNKYNLKIFIDLKIHKNSLFKI